MSYLTPKQWWGKLIRFAVRCQGKSIQHQLEACGATLFDLRIIFDKKDNTPHFAHGIVEFSDTYQGADHSPYTILSYLNSKAEDTPIYVRILNERTLKDADVFVGFCKDIETKFPNLKFYGGVNKKDWKLLYKFTTVEPKVVDKYSSWNNDTAFTGSGWHLDDVYPRVYAVTFNEFWRKYYQDREGFLMEDFIGVY